jgi:hypothetical protein
MSRRWFWCGESGTVRRRPPFHRRRRRYSCLLIYKLIVSMVSMESFNVLGVMDELKVYIQQHGNL